MSQDNRLIFDWSALGITAGALMEILPAISTILSIVWLSLRIWGSIKEIRNGSGKDK